MQLPDKLYKRLPGDPKLYDAAGNTIEQGVYYNRFSDKCYILIWEDNEKNSKCIQSLDH